MDDVVFNNSALTQDHYVNITGGNDKGTFSASLGYYKEDGQIRGTGYERFNGALNGSYKVFPFLTVKANATYSWSTQPELWIGQYEFSTVHALNVRHGTLGMKMELRPPVSVQETVIPIITEIS